jgi:16S rRNA G966 N2-methylase RsmD
MAETPNTVHGRLLEAVHISGYSFERACSELEWLLEEGRWEQLGYADGAAFAESISEVFSDFRITMEERKPLAKKISRIASQRATAKVLGVSHQTIGRDLDDGPNGPIEVQNSTEEAAQSNNNGPDGPPEWFQGDVDPARLAKGRAARKQRDQEAEARRTEELRESAKRGSSQATSKILHGDFREVLKDLRGVNAIITDPPYGKEHLPLLDDLASWADRVLAKDGVLAVLFGQAHLAEVYRRLGGGRPYRWTMAYLTPGPGYVSHARKVQSQWKPVLIYGGGKRFADVLSTEIDGGGIEKSHHEWQQDFSGFQELIRRLTQVGDLVADPFAGSGTTLLAALSCGRNAIGSEINQAAFETANKRLTSL